MPDNSNIVPAFGALMPSRPYDVPEQRVPDVPGPIQLDNLSFEDKERQAWEKFKVKAAGAYDPASIVQPIRWDDPSYENLQQTFDNPERGGRFQKLGFLPGRDNEDYFANSLTKWEKLGLAWDQMGELAKTTFAEQWETEAEFWGNLATGRVKDAFLPFGEQEELQSMYDNMKAITTKNYIPLTTAERAGEFGFGKFATTLGQFGFTLGTIGAYATQLGLEFAFTALTAVESGGASVVAEGASLANKGRRLLTIANMFKNLNRLENTGATANKIKQAYNYLTETQNLKTGFGKFYSFTKQWNAAAGEAKFEAASSYGEHIDNAMERAKQEGRILSLEEKATVEKDARAIAMNNGITNTGLLFVMNRMNMNNLFRGPASVQSRYLTELASNISDDLVNIAGKTVSRFEVPLFSKAGLKETAKSLGKWTVSNAWEGVQEVAQGAAADYWENFYENKYSREKYDNLYLLGKTITDKLEKNESFEEFISGFIIGAPGTMVNAALGRGIDLMSGNQRGEYKKAVADYAKRINEFEADPFRVFDPRVANANTQFSISKQMDEAVRTKNLYAYKNLSKEQMRDMIMLGIKTGKLDYMIGNMKDQITNMSDEDFQQQFAMVSDATNKKKAQDYLNLFENEANNILKEYDKTKQLFPNPYGNFKAVKKGTSEETSQKLKYQAWEDAVQDLIFEKSNYMDTLKRMKDILGDSSEHIGEALYNTYYMMTSDQNVDKEISMLSAEIANDRQIPNPDASVKDRIAKKLKQLEALKKWRKSYTSLTNPRAGAETEELFLSSEEARGVFTEVLNAYQTEENTTLLTPEGVSKAYQGVLDFFKLQEDNKRAVKNISFLASPEGFEQNFNERSKRAELFYNKILEFRKEAVEKRENMLQALEEDTEFANRPDVIELRRHLNDAMVASEYDDAEIILNILQTIYEGKEDQVADQVSTADDIQSADIPQIGETEEGDYLISFEGVNYQVFKDEPALFYTENADGTIDAIENANVPQAVKDVLSAYIQSKTTPAGAPTVKPVTQSSQLNVSFQDLLEKILNADDTTLNMLIADMQSNMSLQPYASFTSAELDELIEALDRRKAELAAQKRQPKPVGTRSENDTDFVKEYNEALSKVKQIVETPGVTVKQVKAAFASMQPVIDTLADKMVRVKYVANLISEQNNIIDRINKINNAKDVNVIKANIQQIFDDTTSLTQAVENVIVLIQNSVDPSIKQEVIEHFDVVFKKKVDDQVAELKALAGEGVTSEVTKKFAEQATTFRNNVISSLEDLEKVSNEIAEESKQNNYSLAVNVDESFDNPTHRYIVDNISPTVNSTLSQRAAIRNLVNAGVITDEELSYADDDKLVEASTVINLGVARIFTIGINKELHRYITLGKKDRKSELESIISTYLQTRDDIKVDDANKLAADIISNIDANNTPIEDVLSSLDIPTTSIISDEHRDLLNRQRQVITDLLRNGNTLDVITTLDEKQRQLVDTVEGFVDVEFVNKLTKFAKKGVDKVEFRKDVIEMVNAIKQETDVKAANKLVNTVLYKYASTNAKAAANLKNILVSTASYVIETQSAIENFETSLDPLNADEMYGVLSGNKVPLTLSQINQVEDFAKNVILEEVKKKFAVPSAIETKLEFNAELLSVPEATVRAKFSVLRPKLSTDIRTTDDLNTELKVENFSFNVHDALKMIVDSDHATLSEKMVASRLLAVIPDTERMTVDNNMQDLGNYDPESNTISINLEALGYKEELPTYPVETVILHELLHRVIENEAANPASSFYRQVRSVIEVVKSAPGSKTYYAFQDNLSEDEQVREFVIEALTNPAFQYHLSKIQYGKSNKTTWQKFVELLAKMFEALGMAIDQTALGETLSIADDLLTYAETEETLSRISRADKETLETLKQDVATNERLNPTIKDSMESLIDKKLQGYAASEALAKVKNMKAFKASDKKTYYYGVENGVLVLMTKTREGYKPVKKESVRIEIINSLLKDNKITSIIPADEIDAIRSIAGDPNTPGTYASGMMLNDEGLTEGEVKFPNAVGAKLNLAFRSKEDYTKFKREYWAAKKAGTLRKGGFDALKSTYGATAVQDYAELASVIDSRKGIEKLISAGFISVAEKGDSLGDLTYDSRLSSDELFDMYKFVLDGGKLNVSEYENTSSYINRILAKVFRTPVTGQLQKEIENELLTEKSTDVDIEIPIEGDELQISSALSQDSLEDASAYAFSEQPIELTNTAIENNPLRSFALDGYTDYKTGEFVENADFRNYYYKVRTIVNALSVKNAEQLKGVMVTFDKDSADLRWDGSAQSETWMNAPKGVVGYLSDEKGNPYVFNKKGDIVGKLDRGNLADQKNLNDGENQIVYFYTFSNPDRPAAKAAQKANPEEFAALMEMRKKVMAGEPQISAVTRITQGQFNKKVLVNATNKNRQDTRNEEFREQLTQPNISFGFSRTSGALIATITAPNGSVNNFALFAPNARYVQVKLSDTQFNLTDYVIELMRVYNEVLLRDPKAAEKIQQNLVTFAHNMWLTGADKNVQIPKHMMKVGVKEYIIDKSGAKIPSLNYYNLFDVINGELVNKEDNIKLVRNYLNNLPMNVWSKWLSGSEPFMFPVITVLENGNRTVTFVNKDYKDFLFREVGMKSNVVEIPQQSDLKAYNSIVHFTEGNPLNVVGQVVAPTPQDIIDNPNVIKDSIKNVGDDVEIDNKELDSLKKGKRFKVPGYTEIFEKICR